MKYIKGFNDINYNQVYFNTINENDTEYTGDIVEYNTISYDDFIEITFWMDGTDQETEEEIVSECFTVLSIVGQTEYRFIFKFTTDGTNFYTYT
jgi:hypothetical protein